MLNEEENTVPKTRTAPDWWKEDPDKAWQEFMELQDEYSRVSRVCSNVQFQRNWVQGWRFSVSAVTKGLSWIPGFPGLPHSEHSDDCDLKLEAWNRWVMWLRGLAMNDDERGKGAERVRKSGKDQDCDIEEFGLKPKHDCQVGCPVLKRVYNIFKREADNLWKQVDEDDVQSDPKVIVVLRSRAAAYSSVCTSLVMAFSPKAAAWMLNSMIEDGGGADDDD